MLLRMDKGLRNWLQREAVKLAKTRETRVISASAAAVEHLKAAKKAQTVRP